MIELDVGRFLTVFYGTWDPAGNVLRFQSAGHPPLLLASAGGNTEICTAGRTALLGTSALTPGSDEHELSLQPGDVFAVFTDGLFERRDRQFDAGLHELGRIVDEHRSESAQSIADALMRDASPSTGWDDDVALLVGRRQERPGG